MRPIRFLAIAIAGIVLAMLAIATTPDRRTPSTLDHISASHQTAEPAGDVIADASAVTRAAAVEVATDVGDIVPTYAVLYMARPGARMKKPHGYQIAQSTRQRLSAHRQTLKSGNRLWRDGYRC